MLVPPSPKLHSYFSPTPLEEERPYWERYFELLKVQDAHARSRCRDSGSLGFDKLSPSHRHVLSPVTSRIS